MKKALVVAGILIFTATSAWAGDGRIIPAKSKPIKDSYIVTFVDGYEPGQMARELADTHTAKIKHIYRHALNGASFDMSAARAQAMANNPHVLSVEEDFEMTIKGDQANPTWGLDRIDERDLPDDNNYHWDFDGTGVRVYVLDTGIRTTHNDFNGRASWGIDCTGQGQSDGNGHGTHVAGTVGSSTYGVAKNVSLIAVKVCTNGGSCPSSATTCGIDYVIQQKQNNPSIPMVANMSLGGGFSQASNNRVANGVASGVFFAVAAGNNNSNACNFSPASEPTAYTVGSTTSSDARSSFSNFGSCLDIFAPGSSITSTWNTSNSATASISGTSMASPHVAGAAALVLDENPTWSPAQVGAELDARATTGKVTGAGSGSPNLLLFTLGGSPPPPPPPPPGGCSVDVDFESGATGWFNDGASTCTTGDYTLGNPTNPGGGRQIVGSHGGSNSVFTAANSSAGVNDVDGGNCILGSPTWSVANASTLSVWYWHGQRDAGDDPSGDFFLLEYSTNGGSSWSTMASRGDQTTSPSWTEATASIPAGSNVEVRVQCSDGAGPGDLVECGIDDVTICE